MVQHCSCLEPTEQFSDEYRFQHEQQDGRIHVYRCRNERYAQNCVVEVDNFGGSSVTMLAAYHTLDEHSWYTL